MRCAVIFPGQGSQAIGMGSNFYENFVWARESFEEASDALNLDMRKLLFEENTQIHQTSFTQPAILLISTIAFQALKREFEINPVFGLGHSLGELSALCATGFFTLKEAVKIVHERGKLMQSLHNDAGMMVVMGIEDSVLEEYIQSQQKIGKKVWFANYNGGGQAVLAGIKEDLKSLESDLKEKKAKRTLLLDISIASHCPLLEPIVSVFKEILSPVNGHFSFEILSNATTDPYKTREEAIELLGSQLVLPVLYKQTIQKHEERVDCFIECGHGSILKGLNRRISTKPTLNVSDTETLKATIDALQE
ncbi:[acyl-carrier-protein] S-malonyltransferase [Helicobacter monodelphidis]|uniref:ACP S-malonyltransferase n=1 Tax=Helicobacter sp. 15-1451 TaxID=2004995 RepID=UPI000DCD2199|nr:ACP S-malonyltransferase [Helicobacter sp. 15-1451]RAX58190.1 [acyl-carrier-protein] S-malonyltransferase [Helicobacter sp. 15-1451]